MNILYVGNAQGFRNADHFYKIPQKLINGFTRIGHNVYIFNDRDYARYSNFFHSSKMGIKTANRKALEICKKFQPELIVLGHCEMIANETLAEIRTICNGVKIIYRNVDPLCSEKNIKDIEHRTGHIDGIFITTAGDALKQFSHTKTFVCFMPNPVDDSIEVGRSFDSNDCDIDLLYAASLLRDMHDHRMEDTKKLIDSLKSIHFEVVGAGINTKSTYGQDYIDLLARSKMGLCLNKTYEYYLYSSDRMSQYMGCGLLIFIHKGPGFSDIFGEDAFVEYQNIEELSDKVLYFVKHDKERRETARRGWERVHDYFDCRKVAQYMIERSFDLKLSQNYNWPTQTY